MAARLNATDRLAISARDRRHARRSWAVIGLAILTFALLGALTGCGGGDVSDDEPDHKPPPSLPDCQAKPEACR